MLDETPVDPFSVACTGISGEATVEHLREFFGFCGDLQDIRVSPDPANPGFQHAIVTFKDTNARDTCLCLSDILVASHPIQVHPIDSASTGGAIAASFNVHNVRNIPAENFEDNNQPHPEVCDPSAPVPPPGGATQREADNGKDDVAAALRTASELVTTIIAQGLVKGDDIAHQLSSRAQAFDNEHHITSRTATAALWIADTVREHTRTLDDKYKLSEKGAHLAETVKDQTHVLDERYGITERGTKACTQAIGMLGAFVGQCANAVSHASQATGLEGSRYDAFFSDAQYNGVSHPNSDDENADASNASPADNSAAHATTENVTTAT